MFAIAPGHDLDSLAAAYRQSGYVQVGNFLTEDSARAAEALLKDETPWGVCFNRGDSVAGLRAPDVSRLTQSQWREITDAVASGARDGFQFFYRYYPLFTDYFDAGRPATPLFRLFEFINAPEFVALMRAITGHQDIAWADAHATNFAPGHFLMRHNDEMPGAHRRAAYVLNFTRDWRPDWGGYLQFFDEDGNIARGVRPLFNAINIFAVPCDHSVGAVSPFAGAPRLSVTGWFRADQPPGPIGNRADGAR